MQQNPTFEGCRGLDRRYALERVTQIPVDEPGCRGNLDANKSRFCINMPNLCMSMLQRLIDQFMILLHHCRLFRKTHMPNINSDTFLRQ